MHVEVVQAPVFARTYSASFLGSLYIISASEYTSADISAVNGADLHYPGYSCLYCRPLRILLQEKAETLDEGGSKMRSSEEE